MFGRHVVNELTAWLAGLATALPLATALLSAFGWKTFSSILKGSVDTATEVKPLNTAAPALPDWILALSRK